MNSPCHIYLTSDFVPPVYLSNKLLKYCTRTARLAHKLLLNVVPFPNRIRWFSSQYIEKYGIGILIQSPKSNVF